MKKVLVWLVFMVIFCLFVGTYWVVWLLSRGLIVFNTASDAYLTAWVSLDD